jgi:WhiB family redox-sensing transcriptional regulator
MGAQRNTGAVLFSAVLPERDTRWTDRALCRFFDPEAWFPMFPQDASHAEKQRYAQQVEAAQEVCQRCPVREDCLKDANDRGESYGIWGGVDLSGRYKERAA